MNTNTESEVSAKSSSPTTVKNTKSCSQKSSLDSTTQFGLQEVPQKGLDTTTSVGIGEQNDMNPFDSTKEQEQNSEKIQEENGNNINDSVQQQENKELEAQTQENQGGFDYMQLYNMMLKKQPVLFPGEILYAKNMETALKNRMVGFPIIQRGSSVPFQEGGSLPTMLQKSLNLQKFASAPQQQSGMQQLQKSRSEISYFDRKVLEDIEMQKGQQQVMGLGNFQQQQHQIIQQKQQQNGNQQQQNINQQEVKNYSLKQGQFKPKKTRFCNCKKTQCLKLYCDCFAVGELCSEQCNCCDCCNNVDNLEIRAKTIEQILEKNPYAFNSKEEGADKKEKSQKRGCNCRKSGCLKKYCQCYQDGVKCGEHCKCTECQNMEGPGGCGGQGHGVKKVFTESDSGYESHQASNQMHMNGYLQTEDTMGSNYVQKKNNILINNVNVVNNVLINNTDNNSSENVINSVNDKKQQQDKDKNIKVKVNKKKANKQKQKGFIKKKNSQQNSDKNSQISGGSQTQLEKMEFSNNNTSFSDIQSQQQFNGFQQDNNNMFQQQYQQQMQQFMQQQYMNNMFQQQQQQQQGGGFGDFQQKMGMMMYMQQSQQQQQFQQQYMQMAQNLMLKQHSQQQNQQQESQ